MIVIFAPTQEFCRCAMKERNVVSENEIVWEMVGGALMNSNFENDSMTIYHLLTKPNMSHVSHSLLCIYFPDEENK